MRALAFLLLALTTHAVAQPTAQVTSPTAGTQFLAPVSISITAQANVPVTRVEFLANGGIIGTATAAPYMVVWSNAPLGTHLLQARIVETDGQISLSPPVPIQVTERTGGNVNSAPTVSLTSPAAGTVLTAPADILLAAQASDTDGSIASVDFFFGDTLITTRSAPPYGFTWTGVPAGTYLLTARVTDDLGAIVTSAAVPITVTQAVAQLYYIHVDHLNTPRLAANQQGQTVWRWDQQEPFGVNVPDDNSSGLGALELPVRFPGQYFDKETQISYNYFRDCYDPATGRYCQSDPIGLRGGFNTYSYVNGNPLVAIDPQGLKALICCRVLDSIFLGTILRQRHCYFNVDGTTFGLYPQGNIGFPEIGNKGDRGGICQECKPLPCSDVNSCIRDQHDFYPRGAYDAVYGPNSNTYVGTIAKACCAGGIPAGTGDAPGLIDPPPK